MGGSHVRRKTDGAPLAAPKFVVHPRVREVNGAVGARVGEMGWRERIVQHDGGLVRYNFQSCLR